jgi:signal transduction histidine kinase
MLYLAEMKGINWRIGLSVLAISIVVATLFYSRFLARQIAANERKTIEVWAEAHRFIARASNETDITFASLILADQQAIPVIETNEKDSITNYLHLDSARVASDPAYLPRKLKEFSKRTPIITHLSDDSTVYNKYYYGESRLLQQVVYYPYVQLIIVALFIMVTLNAVRTRHKAIQDQLWAGMAKETAHQLGTPVMALHGWVEMLRENGADATMVDEMEKDVTRLKLVSDRFSKIGSTPVLEKRDIVAAVQQVVEYIRKRAPVKVSIQVVSAIPALQIPLSYPLFEWVIENLLRNALDAVDGQGNISVEVSVLSEKVIILVKDDGKGMTSAQASRIFQPGYTTRRRGWGLGLTLSKRIIEEYHGGKLKVLSTEPGVGTVFQIILTIN